MSGRAVLRKTPSVDPSDGRAAASVPPRASQASTSATQTGTSGVGGSTAGRLAQAVTRAVAPTTLITALAFFFGWTKTSAQMSYYGLDPTLVGFSNQDYLLRSVDTLFLPLGVVVLTVLLAAWTHALTIGTVRAHHRLRLAVMGVLVVTGGGALLGSVVSIARHPPAPSALPILEMTPAIGVALIAYAIYLSVEHEAPEGVTETAPSPANRRSSMTSTAAAALFATVSLFWAASQYANALGTERARGYVASLGNQPGADVYSRQRLDLRSGGVLEARVGDADSVYRYRYSGLRLLVHSGDSYFLMPASWSPRHGAVIVLHDSGALRFEFTRGAAR